VVAVGSICRGAGVLVSVGVMAGVVGCGLLQDARKNPASKAAISKAEKRFMVIHPFMEANSDL
jgi:ribosomal protein S5